MTHFIYALALVRQAELRREADRLRGPDSSERTLGGLSLAGAYRRQRVRRPARLRVAVRG